MQITQEIFLFFVLFAVSLPSWQVLPGESAPPREGTAGDAAPDRLPKVTAAEEKRQLRDRAIDVFSQDEQTLKLLDGPWDEAFVKKVGQLALRSNLVVRQRQRLMDILAYIAHNHSESAAGRRAVEQFDEAFRISTDDRGKAAAQTWAIAVGSAEDYGGTELLTETFWRGYKAGLPAARTLEKLGDAEILKKLESLAKEGVFPIGSAEARILDETIALIKAALLCPELRDDHDRARRLDKATRVLKKSANCEKNPTK